MNLDTYFTPLSSRDVVFEKDEFMPSLGLKIESYWEGARFPDWQNCRLAVLGVCEGRNSEKNPGSAYSPNAIRGYLYSLAAPADDFSCVDLGNIEAGATPEDTMFALTEILYQLIEKEVTVIILGGSQALSLAQYRAYEILGRVVNLVSIDSQFDLENRETVTSRSWLNHIVQLQPNYLFNLTNLGYQTYLNGTSKIRLMEDLQFDSIRLGLLQGDTTFEAEPYIRAADLLSFDISAVRQCDAPGNGNVSPHGLYGEELCTLMRYAGMSDKLSSIGFYEANLEKDRDGQTMALVAHAVWHFMEGFFNRLGDCPYNDVTNYKRYLVPLNEGSIEITFYKSRRSDRWWFEVPCNPDEMQKYHRNLLIPCTYDDYQQAVNNMIPDRWWKFYNRVN